LLSPGGTNERGPLTPEFVSKATFSITETGKRVLKSEKDFVSLNGLDQWLGGVHLRPDNMWRWDKASGRVSK
ncbi:MAG TPA: hypothetical protein VGW36_07705, partial [Pyrinomonadaceae bacterium]|nr:hypothetical protein [Pyrinomonadaceae bacterium]